LWFAGNGVLEALVEEFQLPDTALGHLTTVIQLGFIAGTLVFAMLRIVDRYRPSNVFLLSAVAGALLNFALIAESNTFATLLILRFGTGFFLAGIYPVGMKIASDYFEKGLGQALGFLVGALVVGTALPHLLRSVVQYEDWRVVIVGVSVIAVLGGLIIGLFVGDGPYRRAGLQLKLRDVFGVFKVLEFRRAAFGYFGHMWELYAFWAFTPVFLHGYLELHGAAGFDVSLWSFLIIGIGGAGCVLAGYIAQVTSVSRAGVLALAASGICCAASAMMFSISGQSAFVLFLLIWGLTVVADSPMFSTLVAWKAPAELRGTALTLVTCIGFAITIVSIQLLNFMQLHIGVQYLFLILIPGPVLGLIAMTWKARNSPQ
jgi:predicted MFS family arabinose efflux permease